MMVLSEKLGLVRHVVSKDAHIVLDTEKCAGCARKDCLYFCPAECFTRDGDGILFHYEGCLECGTCRIICPKNALSWDYPQGGFGVTFRMG